MNALYAEDMGTFTAGTFRKKYNIPLKSFDLLLKLGVIKNTEWHHTGKSFTKSDFFSWADSSHGSGGNKLYDNAEVEKGSLGYLYAQNKKEIDGLAKEFAEKEWEFETEKGKFVIPSFDTYLNQYVYIDDFLTENEKEQREIRHREVSAGGSNIGTPFERRQMHERIDESYNKIARERRDEQREEYKRKYEEEFSDKIKQNEAAETFNANIKETNLATNGKEKALLQILYLLGEDKETGYDKVSRIAIREKAEKEYQERQAKEQEIRDRFQSVFDGIEKKREDWIKKKLKEGAIERVERVREKPQFFIIEKEEMNGRYGWFEASYSYRLPRYYSGLDLKSARNFNHYNSYEAKRREAVDEMVGEINSLTNQDNSIKFGKEDKNRVPLTKSEEVLRGAVIDRIRRSGIEVIDDPAVGQRVLDMANGNAKEQAKKKRALETASLRATPRSLTVISSADGAKILQNIEELANELTESVSQPKTFVGKVAKALGATRDGSKSEYATFETKNGKVVTIRLADHNAKVSNFDRRNELSGISIVVSPKVNTGMTNDGDAHIVEYYYDAIKLRKAEGKPLAEIVRSIQQALYSGEFKDTTGLAERQEVNADNLREHRVYHGSGAEFEAFDHSHMSEGEGQQAYGWGTYVTEVDDIGKYYAKTSFLIAEEKRSSSRRASPISMAVGAIIHQENYNLQAVSFEQRKEAAIADLETKIKIDENVLRNEKEDETMTACKSLPTRECGWKRFTISIIAVR